MAQQMNKAYFKTLRDFDAGNTAIRIVRKKHTAGGNLGDEEATYQGIIVEAYTSDIAAAVALRSGRTNLMIAARTD